MWGRELSASDLVLKSLGTAMSCEWQQKRTVLLSRLKLPCARVQILSQRSLLPPWLCRVVSSSDLPARLSAPCLSARGGTHGVGFLQHLSSEVGGNVSPSRLHSSSVKWGSTRAVSQAQTKQMEVSLPRATGHRYFSLPQAFPSAGGCNSLLSFLWVSQQKIASLSS